MLNNKIKLVITHPCELSQRWITYYCLDELCNDFDIEYWDCSAIVTAYTSGKMQYPIKRDYLVVIKSLQMFKALMERLPKDTVLITEIHYNQFTLEFHRIQSSFFPRYAHINFYANTQLHLSKRTEEPSRQNRSMLTEIVHKAVQRVEYYSYKLPKMQDLIWRLHHYRDPDYTEKAAIRKIGKWYKGVWGMSSAKGSKRRINHPDYEQYLKDKDFANLTRNVVFVDNFFPYHPEISYCERELDVESVAQSYYSSLNAFFDKLEQTYNCHVVIAAHPSSIFNGNPFDGRKIYYGETSSLIRDCEMVCMHTSNAFSYVVLYNKPVALLYNKAFKQAHFQMQRLEYCSEQFSLPLINTDNKDINLTKIFNQVNADIRNNYINDYLADEKLSANNAELITRYLVEFHEQLLRSN